MIFLETAFAMAVAMSGYVWLCWQVKKKNYIQKANYINAAQRKIFTISSSSVPSSPLSKGAVDAILNFMIVSEINSKHLRYTNIAFKHWSEKLPYVILTYLPAVEYL